MENNINKLESINLTEDYFFAKVMEDSEICKEFLELVLMIKIKELKYINNQEVIKNGYDSKGSRLDLYIKDENGTIYDIEMQRTDSDHIPKRMRYYQSNIDLDNMKKGKRYKELPNSYIIFICSYDLFGEGRYKYTFEEICKENHKLALGDGTKKIVLNTKGILNDVDDELKELFDYMEKTTFETELKCKSEFVKKIVRKVKDVREKELITVV